MITPLLNMACANKQTCSIFDYRMFSVTLNALSFSFLDFLQHRDVCHVY